MAVEQVGVGCEELEYFGEAAGGEVVVAADARAFLKMDGRGEAIRGVCDEGGQLVAFQRMDGAFSESIAFAIGQAIAAAASRKSSGDKDEVLDLQSVWRVAGAGLPVIAGRGGLPITRNAQTVGAIGVSGSATDQEDEQCAKAGVEALDQSS
jgi:uncharacterized protein GlcG (DUF336 family)